MKKLIPCRIYGKDFQSEDLLQIIKDSLSEIEELLIGDLSYFSENAQYNENSLHILSVEKRDQNYYSMTYQFQWAIFNGCLDINAEESMTQSVLFSVIPSGIEFDIIELVKGTPENEL